MVDTDLFSRWQRAGNLRDFQDHLPAPSRQQDLIAQVTHIASIAIERALADEVYDQRAQFD
jgi:hypothetical protein